MAIVAPAVERRLKRVGLLWEEQMQPQNSVGRCQDTLVHWPKVKLSLLPATSLFRCYIVAKAQMLSPDTALLESITHRRTIETFVRAIEL